MNPDPFFNPFLPASRRPHADLPPWPYPRLIAHRGGGKLAPENTLAAFQCGANHGFEMFECDVKSAADGALFLLHDTKLDRTTTGKGVAGALDWAALSGLDAGSWHSPRFAGERLLRLDALASWLRERELFVNLEIKPTPGLERETGAAVAEQVRRLWGGARVPPLLSSFSEAALEAAAQSEPDLPRALLLETFPSDWVQRALALRCVAVVGHDPELNHAHIAQAHAAGLRMLVYTVDDPARARDLWSAGLDGLITDALDRF